MAEANDSVLASSCGYPMSGLIIHAQYTCTHAHTHTHTAHIYDSSFLCGLLDLLHGFLSQENILNWNELLLEGKQHQEKERFVQV